MIRRVPLATALFFALLAASLVTAVLVVRARTPDLVLEVTGWTPCSRELSPALDGARGRVRVTFFVREADDAARITIVDSHERTVRTLASKLALAPEEEVSFTWDGRTDAGATAAPGLYRLGVELPVGRSGDDLASADRPRRPPAGRRALRGAQLSASALELIGIVAASLAAATALIAGDRRIRAFALVIAFITAPVIVAGSVWDEPRVVDLRESPLTLAVGLIAAVGLLAALTLVFRRHPDAVRARRVFSPGAARPAGDRRRGGEPARAPLPGHRRGSDRLPARRSATTPVRRQPAESPWSVWLRRALGFTLVLYALQSAYSDDVANAIEDTGFFLVPFAVLAVLLFETTWNADLLERVLVAVAVVAVGCAVVAIGQYAIGDLFLNPELFDANQLHVYFRVNSIFFDPNILGRYLALAITALGACIAWQQSRRDAALALLACGVCLAGLAFSYSITSFAALIAGLGMVALLRWSWRGALAAAAMGLVALVALARRRRHPDE